MNTKKEAILNNIAKIEQKELKEKFKKEIEVIFEEKEEILSLKNYSNYILTKKIHYNLDFYDEEDEEYVIDYLDNKIKEIMDFYQKEWNIRLLLLNKKILITDYKIFAEIKIIPHKRHSHSLILNLDWEEYTEEDNYSKEEEEKKRKEDEYIQFLAEQHRQKEIIVLQQKIENEIKNQQKNKGWFR